MMKILKMASESGVECRKCGEMVEIIYEFNNELVCEDCMEESKSV